MNRLEKIERRRLEREANESAWRERRLKQRMLGLIVGALVLVGGGVAWNAGLFGGPASAHPYAAFAQCLTNKGLVMYGTDWCPNCQNQKKMFKKAFEFIDYVNCDFNKTLCKQKQVNGYPAFWVGDEKWEAGVKSFAEFSEKTGCPLP